MEKERQSNYDKVIENWRLKFLEMDHGELIRRFHLGADGEALYVTYFSQLLRLDRKTGVMTYENEGPLKGQHPGFHTTMTIYNSFHYALPQPFPSGKLVPFRQVKRVYPFEQAYRNTVIRQFQDTFSGHVREMEEACKRLGGTPMPQGDVGYVIPVFPFLNIAVLFWDGDEEFSAQANILFDSNITDFMHEENVVQVAYDAVYYLTLAAGLGAE